MLHVYFWRSSFWSSLDTRHALKRYPQTGNSVFQPRQSKPPRKWKADLLRPDHLKVPFASRAAHLNLQTSLCHFDLLITQPSLKNQSAKLNIETYIIIQMEKLGGGIEKAPGAKAPFNQIVNKQLFVQLPTAKVANLVLPPGLGWFKSWFAPKKCANVFLVNVTVTYHGPTAPIILEKCADHHTIQMFNVYLTLSYIQSRYCYCKYVPLSFCLVIYNN